MKTTFLVPGAAALILTGCLVTSVYPFYTERDLTFEPALVGSWTKVQDTSEHWTFAGAGTNAYQLTYSTKDQTNVMQAHLFKLNDQRFLDLFAPDQDSLNRMPPAIPSHFLLRVEQVSPNIRMSALNHEWLKNLVEKDPNAVRHHALRIGDKAEDLRVVLTGDTAELQKFLTTTLTNHDAWDDTFELKRD